MQKVFILLDSLSYIPDNIWFLLKKIAAKNHLIIQADSKFASQLKGALIYKTPDDLITAINKISSPDLSLSHSSENIRYRHVEKGGDQYYMLFNEEASVVSTVIMLQAPDGYREGTRHWIDPFTAEISASSDNEMVQFKPHEMKILRVSKAK
jgi:hypothetical protein